MAGKKVLKNSDMVIYISLFAGLCTGIHTKLSSGFSFNSLISAFTSSSKKKLKKNDLLVLYKAYIRPM